MLSHSRPMPDQPETTGVHGILAGVIFTQCGVAPNPPRTPYDGHFTFEIDGNSFTVDIIPERSSKVGTLGMEEGRFPWNGRWTLRLNSPGGCCFTYRPTHQTVIRAAHKIAEKAKFIVSLRQVASCVPYLRLVVNNPR